MIEISGYTKKEKLAIAIDHLLPDILEETERLGISQFLTRKFDHF